MRRPPADPADATRQYRRGAVMGLTVAEAFMLLAFVLLMLMLLWRSEDAERLASAQEFLALPPPERAAVQEVVEAFRAAGVSPDDPALQEKLDRLVAVGATDTAPPVLDALIAATPEERRKLEALIRSDAWRDAASDSVGERVADRLQAAAENRARVTRALERELGPAVAAAGGVIDPDGSLVFPDAVLFAAGEARITPELRGFLERICLPWFRTLERTGVAISELRIEGHASSEWTGLTPEQAYLANLALSQERAHAVLSTCLELVPGPEGGWARQRATAIGYSSSHPVLSGGQEDQDKSRRVVFRVDLSLREVIEGIEDEVQRLDPLAAKRQVFE